MRRILLLAAVSCAGAPSAPVAEPAPAVGGALFRHNDIVAYELRDEAGKVVGRSHSTFLVNADGETQVLTRVEAQPGVSAEHVTTFRGDLSPIAYKRLRSTDGRYSLEFRGERIRVFAEDGAREPVVKPARAVIVPEDDLMMLAIALRAERLEPGSALKMDVYSVDALASRPWPVQVYADASKRTVVELPVGKALLDAAGRVERLERAGLAFVPEVPAKAPPKVSYEPPIEYRRPAGARFEDRAARIEVEGGVLAGILSIPRDVASWPSQKPPAVVFFSEEGPHDRHGFMGRIDYGSWAIFDHLSDHGFATLRLDDRGVGASVSEVPRSEQSVDLHVMDGLRVVEWLRRQPEIDAEQIIVLGHGKGGLVALAVAKKAEPRGLALLAAPLPKQSSLDVVGMLSSFDRPIAVFQGLKDAEVSWKDDAKVIVEYLSKGSAKRLTEQFFYDRVDHLMKTESQTSSFERYLDRTRAIDRRFLDDLVAWMTKIVRGP